MSRRVNIKGSGPAEKGASKHPWRRNPSRARFPRAHYHTSLSHFSDFSDVESNPSGAIIIQKLVKKAGEAAASEASALGIPKVFARGGEVIREYADGRAEVISTAGMNRDGAYFVRSAKAGILHARKK
jgi:hypothetical protein